MNAHGIEVVSVLLSTETAGGNDDDVIEVANPNGYDLPGLDSTADRMNARAGLGYYRGAPATPWPIDDRRRLAVVSTVAGSSSHQQNEILYNQEFPLSGAVIAAIDAVQAAPAGTTYDAWKATQSFPANQDGPDDDPDHDGWCNLLEYHAETNPLGGSSVPTSILTRTAPGFTYRYRRAMDRIGVTHTLQAGPLDALTTFTPSGESALEIAPNIEEVTVPLPPGFGPFLRQAIALDP